MEDEARDRKVYRMLPYPYFNSVNNEPNRTSGGKLVCLRV